MVVTQRDVFHESSKRLYFEMFLDILEIIHFLNKMILLNLIFTLCSPVLTTDTSVLMNNRSDYFIIGFFFFVHVTVVGSHWLLLAGYPGIF